uniref:NADH-ubiquinone oxidoreductase chain 3 n=1 Tax=Colponema vietnamica TaxID=1492817 RepID=V5KV63_9ALVE|nr:NADH dehydrogenase subunit 3 [Colponema vietnamica]ATY40850.1 NADH dehydrogenase subunit 3 [Colponema vietnamica]
MKLSQVYSNLLVNPNLLEYNKIFIFVIISFGLAFILFGLSYLISDQRPDLEKFSAYECGFNPFNDARQPFDIRFYIVAILFIIFDLEIVFLYPWAVNFKNFSYSEQLIVNFFILILVIGLVYEWNKKALEWE